MNINKLILENKFPIFILTSAVILELEILYFSTGWDYMTGLQSVLIGVVFGGIGGVMFTVALFYDLIKKGR